MSGPSTSRRANSEKRSFIITLARYSQLAFVLPAATFAGWVLGALLDKWLHTSWLYLAGLLLGIVAGFVELIRTTMKSGSWNG
jgi:F0F1-type ATP synthase assembly protein I